MTPAITIAPRRGLRWPKLSPVMCTAVLAVMLVLVLYPILLLIYSSFLVDAGGKQQLSLELWRTAWFQAGILDSVINTFLRVVATEFIAFPIAVMMAWLVARTCLLYTSDAADE